MDDEPIGDVRNGRGERFAWLLPDGTVQKATEAEAGKYVVFITDDEDSSPPYLGGPPRLSWWRRLRRRLRLRRAYRHAYRIAKGAPTLCAVERTEKLGTRFPAPGASIWQSAAEGATSGPLQTTTGYVGKIKTVCARDLGLETLPALVYDPVGDEYRQAVSVEHVHAQGHLESVRVAFDGDEWLLAPYEWVTIKPMA